ncbi:hypothetical protein ACQKIW_30675 [Bacillus thuringiensis]|uniref:hypothetical protein n=1 Tax=Bacillus thuringiensis TaxID=1428 RepID=UPI003CFDB5A6
MSRNPVVHMLYEARQKALVDEFSKCKYAEKGCGIGTKRRNTKGYEKRETTTYPGPA